MPIGFHPKPGQVLICDYNTGFIIPEMVKRRPVIVISPRLRRRNDLCTVVPLSTTAPQVIEQYHLEVTLRPALPAPWSTEVMWVKCDMIATVSFKRLDLIRGPKDFQGKRKYITHSLDGEDLSRIRRCVLYAIGWEVDKRLKCGYVNCRTRSATASGLKTLPRAAAPEVIASSGAVCRRAGPATGWPFFISPEVPIGAPVVSGASAGGDPRG